METARCRKHFFLVERSPISADTVIKFIVQLLLATAAMMSFQLGSADEGQKLPTIGLAIPVDPATDEPYQKALREGLSDLGWVDGKNVTLIVRYANGDPARLRALIRELVASRVDVLMADAPVGIEATRTIPIVSATMGDPVKTGLVVSLARPGGNLTGVSAQSYDIWPKQLELARELVKSRERTDHSWAKFGAKLQDLTGSDRSSDSVKI